MKKCSYCQTDNQAGEYCDKCGAKLPEIIELIEKSEPFFYNGFICYSLRNYQRDTFEIQFWLGDKLIERIAIPRTLYKARVKDGDDSMSLFWDLFLLSQGHENVIFYEKQNNRECPLFVFITRTDEESKRYQEMSLSELWEEVGYKSI